MTQRALVLIAAALIAAGCAAADKPAPGSSSSAGMTSDTSTSSGSMSAMSMGNVGGIKAVPERVLGTATWQGMRITAQAMTAVPFVIYNGTTEQMVKPTSKTSFHLMVMLNDAHTGVAIPYAGVWATIDKGSQVVYDERQWPMISEYMGPHYGNDVSLPGAGSYRLTLLVSPPVSARHVEYQKVWLSPHRVSMRFSWTPPA